jgi:CDP-diacylglycerol---glycerol-3-phosphate 3-phosphatidyltransferase
MTNTHHDRRMLVTSLPNLLTYGRILAVPALVATFYFDGMTARWIALSIFIVAGITDFLDGYLARIWDQQSSLGRMLDPIADKLIVSSALLMLASDDTIAGWSLIPTVVILMREILVSGLREFLAELRISVPSSRLAKWKTAVQIVSICFLLAGEAGETILPGTLIIGIAGLWFAAIITLYTGYEYFRAGIKHLLEQN